MLDISDSLRQLLCSVQGNIGVIFLPNDGRCFNHSLPLAERYVVCADGVAFFFVFFFLFGSFYLARFFIIRSLETLHDPSYPIRFVLDALPLSLHLSLSRSFHLSLSVSLSRSISLFHTLSLYLVISVFLCLCISLLLSLVPPEHPFFTLLLSLYIYVSLFLHLSRCAFLILSLSLSLAFSPSRSPSILLSRFFSLCISSLFLTLTLDLSRSFPL